MNIDDDTIEFESSFWEMLFYQIVVTKRAQFAPDLQVELGKAVVVEEISRTFLTQQTLEPAGSMDPSKLESEASSGTNAKNLKVAIDLALTKVE